MLNVNVINAKNTQKVEVKPGQPANLKVDPNTRFELVDSASGKAPAQIKARRVGDNLEIVTDEKAQIEDEALSNAQKPDLVLENYYKQADVSLFAGAGEEAVSYVPVDGAASSSYAAMNTSATTGAALGVLPLLNPLLGAAVVGAGAVVATNGNDTGTSNQVPVAQDAATKVTENKVVSDKVPTATDADGTVASYRLVNDVAAGKLTFNADGSYSFEANKDFDSLADGQTKTVSFTYSAVDNAGGVSEPKTVTITVTGANDAPVASAATKSVDEGMKVEGSVSATDADAGAALKYALVGTAPAGLIFNADGTYTFDANNEAYNSLKAGETKDLMVKFKANDGAVDSAEQTLTITVKGTNDAPVATYVTAQTATEDDVKVVGQLTSSDVDKDATATYAADGAAIAGLTINADGSWTFDPTNAAYQSLVEGDSREVTVTYKVTDDQGASDTESFKITVTGTNDAPTISVQWGDKDTGSMNENDTQEIAGSLTLNDVDADGWTMHGVGVRIGESSTFDYSNQLSAEQQSLLSSKLLNLFTLNAVQNAQLNQNNNQQWSFKSENASDFDFLPVNKTLVVEYVVSVTDAHEATTTHIVSIAITGKNDAPVIQLTGNDLDQATLTESNKVLSASGTLTVTDPDDNDSIVSFEVIDVQLDPTVQSFLTIEQFASVQSALKSFLTLSAVGTMVDLHNLEWTFDSAYDNNLDLIPEGATLSLKYTIEVKDSAGTTTSHVVTVKIDGTNDGPAIQVQSGDTDRADLTETNSALSASGTVSLFDMDLTDEVNYVISDVALNTTVTSFLSADDFAIIKEQVKGFMTLEAIGYLNDGNNLQWTFDSTGDSHSGFIPAGQTLALDYTVTATDKSGEIATQVIHINILGTNAIPLIEFKGTDSAAESLIETDDVLSTTGTMSLTDLDFNDPANATRISVKVTGFDGGFDDTYFLGMLKLSTETYQNGDPLRVNEPHNVRWKFGSFAQDDFDYLVQDEVLELEYTIEVKDSLGATSQQVVAVSITGTNDAPQVFVWDGDSASGSILSPTQDVTGSLSIFDEDVVTAYFAGVKFDGVQITDTTLQSSLYSLLLIDPTSTYKTVNEPHNFDWRFNTTDAFAKGLTSGLSAGEHQLTYTMDFVDTYSAEHKQDINILFTV